MGDDTALRGDYYGKVDGNGIALTDEVTALRERSPSTGIIVVVKEGDTAAIITGTRQHQ